MDLCFLINNYQYINIKTYIYSPHDNICCESSIVQSSTIKQTPDIGSSHKGPATVAIWKPLIKLFSYFVNKVLSLTFGLHTDLV